MPKRDAGEGDLALRAVLALLLLGVAWGLGRFLLLPRSSTGLGALVRDHLPESGVTNPVTAVLLDFRGYDTLLEIAVLTATLVGVWALGITPLVRQPASSAVLRGLDRIILPIVPLVAGYLLWVGASGTGGAFQAGAVLASGGVLHILAGHGWPRMLGGGGRLQIVIGLSVFLGVAVGLAIVGRGFLDYPRSGGPALMLAIELAATLSIGTILLGLFLGGRVEPEQAGDEEEGAMGPDDSERAR